MKYYLGAKARAYIHITQRLIMTLIAFCIIYPAMTQGQTPRQTQADDYTCYELLAPESQSFRIAYDVTATTPGSHYFYNAIRVGSVPTVHGVYDLMTGKKLEWKIVDASTARQGGVRRANPEGKYIQVKLARPVPEGGEARIRIDKTYKDPKSYYQEGDKLIFSRTLGIKRNSVVLPEGFELVRCNYPSQILLNREGRIKLSYMNRSPAGIPYLVEARQLQGKAKSAPSPKTFETQEEKPAPKRTGSSSSSQTRARTNYRFSERAFQDREIVYFLQQPETHSFRLYHDYTESRKGMDRYLNLVRAGSKATNPSAVILDTGEKLKVETLKGETIRERGIQIGAQVTAETEVVVIWFDPIKEGQSVRLRIEETYTDPNRYLLHGDELVWDRSFGRSQNTVILPEGWYVTTNSIPAVISETEDGKIRLFYMNDRPGNIDVFLRARRR